MIERIATSALMAQQQGAMARAQRALADTGEQLSTGRRVHQLTDLGSAAPAHLAATALLAREDGFAAAGQHVQRRLEGNAAALATLDSSAEGLRQTLLSAFGSGQGSGLDAAIAGAFDQIRAALNARDGDSALFGGGQSAANPFTADTLDQLAGADPATLFGDDGLRASTLVAPGIAVTHGLSAATLGGDLVAALQSLAQAGPFGERITDAQRAALESASDRIANGLKTVRAADADNGRALAFAETLATRGQQRADLLRDQIARTADADMGAVATRLAQQQAQLSASYAVFGQLSRLSLLDYLR